MTLPICQCLTCQEARAKGPLSATASNLTEATTYLRSRFEDEGDRILFDLVMASPRPSPKADEYLAAIREGLSQGRTMVQIAGKLEVSQSFLYQVLDTAGLTVREIRAGLEGR